MLVSFYASFLYYALCITHRQEGVIAIFSKYFPVRLKQLRLSKNISQQTVADSIGINKASISRIESGAQSVTVETLIALADYFQVSVDYLTGRSNIQKLAEDVMRPASLTVPISFVDDNEKALHEIYKKLDTYSRGMLLERAQILSKPITRPTSIFTE